MRAKDLKNSILQMAVEGKLVPQDPADEPASALLEHIREERRRLVAEKKIKAPKGGESVIYLASDGSRYEKFVDAKGRESEPVCVDDEIPFDVPEGWEWARLNTLAWFGGGKTPPTSDASLYAKDGTLWVTSKDMKRGIIDSTLITLSDKGAALLDKYPAVSIVMVTRSGILRRLLPVAVLAKEATVNQDQKVTIPFDSSSSEWLPIVFRAFDYYIRSELGKAGTTVESVNFELVKRMLVPVPPLAEQRRIAERVAGLMPLVEEYGALEDGRGALDASLPERLRKSILQEAVRGRLVPQDPADEPASALLARIRAERAAKVASGELKAPKGGESVICLGSDGAHYEKRGKGDPACIEDEIPFDVPEGWEWARLGSLVLNRKQIKPTKSFCYIDIASIDNVNNRLAAGETIIEAKSAPSRARKPVAVGDVLYATVRPYLHNACIVDKEFSHGPIASTGFASMVCPEGLSERYLLECLLSPFFDDYANDLDNSKGVAYPAINDERLYRALIPVPPTVEQRRIVDRVNELLALLA